MKKTIRIAGIAIVLLAVLLALVAVRFRYAWHERGKAMGLFQIEHVSLINLIATPGKYHEKRVRVEGVCNLEFEGDALFLSQEDRRHFITKNAVWISPDTATLGANPLILAAEFNGRHVLVEGVFDMKDKGHFGMFSGAITNVTRMMTSFTR